jgi:hypothetical protein
MSRAIISIRNEDFSQEKTSKMCNTLSQTFQPYLRKAEFTAPKPDRKPKMRIESENKLYKYLILRQECGFGLTKNELRVLAFNFMEMLRVTDSVKTQKWLGCNGCTRS